MIAIGLRRASSTSCLVPRALGGCRYWRVIPKVIPNADRHIAIGWNSREAPVALGARSGGPHGRQGNPDVGVEDCGLDKVIHHRSGARKIEAEFDSDCSVCSAIPSERLPVTGSVPTVPSRRQSSSNDRLNVGTERRQSLVSSPIAAPLGSSSMDSRQACSPPGAADWVRVRCLTGCRGFERRGGARQRTP